MTDQLDTHIKRSRMRVARSRGALGGGLLIVFGAWAALIEFIGPYFNFAMTPQPDNAFHWTAARGWLEVLPGAAAVLGGILLLISANRLVTSIGGWIAAAGGAWLVVGPTLSGPFGLDLGSPDPAAGSNKQALIALLFFYAIGAAIVLVAGLALGRLSVHSVRDVRAAEHRAVQEAEREEAERRAAEDRVTQDRAERERLAQEPAAREPVVQEPRAPLATPREEYSPPVRPQEDPNYRAVPPGEGPSPAGQDPSGHHIPTHADPQTPAGYGYPAYPTAEGEQPVQPPARDTP